MGAIERVVANGYRCKNMKIITRSIAAAGTVLAASAGTAAAAEVVTNLYVKVDAGAVFQQNADWQQSGKQTLTVGFNPGTRADIAVGYNLSKTFAVELESGFMWDSIDTFDGRGPIPVESADLYSVPILANAIYKFPATGGWTPYVGAGVGLNVGIFDGSNPSTSFTDSDLSFAYQAEAGVKYALAPHASVGIAYKLLGTTDQDYSSQTFSNIYVHGLFASFMLSF